MKYRDTSERSPHDNGRSREGAWIEIALSANYNLGEGGRSREGAWIEILSGQAGISCLLSVAPVRERGLKYPRNKESADLHWVAPVRERGLK